MKNSLSFLVAALMALAAVCPAQARDVLTVFPGGDEPNWTVPINLLYLDEVGTRSQVIYPAEALSEMKNEPINSITFYTHDNIEASGGSVRVLVGETSQSSFGSYVEDLTQVATITIQPGSTQLTVVFDTPFMYGGGNLVVESIVDEAGICSENADLFVCERLDYYCSRSRNEVSRAIPMATFGYGTDEPYAAKILPVDLTFNTVRAGREDVQSFILKNVGANAFTATFIVPEPFVVDLQHGPVVVTPQTVSLDPNQTKEVRVKFNPTEPGSFNDVLTVDCGSAGIYQVALHANAIAAAQDLTVCDGTAVGTLPIDGVYIDIVGTEGQMIYPAENLTDMVNSDIVEIKFYPQRIKMNGGVVTLSLSTTEQAEYTENVLLTGLTTVATLTPVGGSSDFVFVLDQPFRYTGGNLVVDALVTEPGEENLESSTFFGVATEYWSSLEAWSYYGYYVGFLGFLPKATFSYIKEGEGGTYKPGDVNHDGNVDVSDVTATISVALGGDPDPFFMNEADLNGDGVIDVSDVTAVISFALNQ